MASRDEYPSEKQDRFIVRLPDGMRDRIRSDALASGRSMNAEIVSRLDGTGKSLRDDIAIAVVNGLLSDAQTIAAWHKTAREIGQTFAQYLAASAYEIADALLAARNAGEGSAE